MLYLWMADNSGIPWAQCLNLSESMKMFTLQRLGHFGPVTVVQQNPPILTKYCVLAVQLWTYYT